SASQLGRFLSAFIGAGQYRGTRILSAPSVREMRHEQVPSIIRGQGLIWYYDRHRGDTLLGHNGGDLGVNTRMFFRPGDGLGVITLTNGDASSFPQDQALQQIQDRLFQRSW